MNGNMTTSNIDTKGKTIFNYHYTALFLVVFSLTACNSNPPAPVINRAPNAAQTQTTPQKSTSNNRQTYKAGDWRPDTYIVKPGDTLFSIGLAFGYDYKDIASANRISAPYMIRVGQTLQFAKLKADETQGATDPTSSDDGNVTTFALGDMAPAAVTTKSATPAIVAISEPKAIREPYSDTAFNTALPTEKATAAASTDVNNPSATAKPVTPDASASTTAGSTTKATDAKDAAWSWPTKGKVLSLFNQGGNKGIDIGGTRGQAINATGAGKVIYSGSDLRGYGKLVIIKHNATFLSVYAHNSAIMVKEGQQVTRGQKIAEMGDSDSPNVKLHFEIRKQGQSVDPVPYLAEN